MKFTISRTANGGSKIIGRKKLKTKLISRHSSFSQANLPEYHEQKGKRHGMYELSDNTRF